MESSNFSPGLIPGPAATMPLILLTISHYGFQLDIIAGFHTEKREWRKGGGH